MTQRFWLITVSVAGHLVLGVGMFVTNVWRLDKLDTQRPTTADVAVLDMPLEASGSPIKAPEKSLEKKKPPEKKIVTEPVQPVEKLPDPPKDPGPVDVVTTTGTGNGSGSGTGSGTGSGSDPGGCLLPPCGKAKPAPVEQVKVEAPRLILPGALKALRIDGETQVHPSDNDKTAMMRDGLSKTVVSVQVCIGIDGTVTSAKMFGSTHYADYDARLLAAVHGWHYRPFLVDGHPAPACGMTQFVYMIQ